MPTYTYNEAALDVHLNWIRLSIGDTDIAGDPQLSDAEINAVLAREPRREQAAAACCRLIAGRYSRFGAMKEAEAFFLLAETILMQVTPEYL